MSNALSLHWLIEAVAIRRDRVMTMLRQMTGLGARGGMSPPVFHKFLGLLDQIAVERQAEDRLLDRIKDVESEHRHRRAHGQLATAGHGRFRRSVTTGQNPVALVAPQPKRRLSWLAVLVLLFRPKMK